MIKGSATKAGTMAYASKRPLIAYRPFLPSELFISGAGFGCYRVDIRVPEHQAALRLALESGVNLVDTSANYANGESERLVGKVLRDLAAMNKLKREEIIVVSKVGYLQGENYEISQIRKQAERPFKDLVLYAEGLEHCIHPEFLAEQLTGSLERLGLETIDCYLLHNPEYYLQWAQANNVSNPEAQKEYYRRIHVAFLHLEEEVRQGRINYYGISSNTFPRPQSHFDFTSLADIWEIAQAISTEHHFRVIQFPLNLLEPAAVLESNQPNGKSVLDFAREQGLGVLTNRPLNAIRKDQLIRLAENVYEGELISEVTKFKEKIAGLNPSWENTPSLSQLALRVLRSTGGINAVLMGMRRDAYVEDVLKELQQPSEIFAEKILWRRIQDI